MSSQQVDSITNAAGSGSVSFPNGVQLTQSLGIGGTSVAMKDYQEGAYSTAFTMSGSGGGTSGTVSIMILRIGSQITLNIPLPITANTGTSSTTFNATANLPTWAIPSRIVGGFSPAEDNGVSQTTPGVFRVETTGQLRFFRDNSNSAFTNSTIGGVQSAGPSFFCITYSLL